MAYYFNIPATLREGFQVRINARTDEDDNLVQVDVFSAKTGEDLNDLIFDTAADEEAWNAVEKWLACPAEQARYQKEQQELDAE